MQIIGLIGSVATVRRKLRALTAVIADAGATEHEKANAEALRARLERRLKEAGGSCGGLDGQRFPSRQMGKGSGEICHSHVTQRRLDG
jgi:hypothetical protein